jgi:hypothetical protein
MSESKLSERMLEAATAAGTHYANLAVPSIDVIERAAESGLDAYRLNIVSLFIRLANAPPRDNLSLACNALVALDKFDAALRASESRLAGIEPQGCPTPGACSCHPDAVAKAVETAVKALMAAKEKEGGNFIDPYSILLDDALLGLAAIRARTASPSPPFDEAAERAAFEKYWEDTRESFGVADVHYKSMSFAWLASAQRRRDP